MIAITLPNWKLDLVTHLYAIEFLLALQDRLVRQRSPELFPGCGYADRAMYHFVERSKSQLVQSSRS